jgi:hypothetical protein
VVTTPVPRQALPVLPSQLTGAGQSGATELTAELPVSASSPGDGWTSDVSHPVQSEGWEVAFSPAGHGVAIPSLVHTSTSQGHHTPWPFHGRSMPVLDYLLGGLGKGLVADHKLVWWQHRSWRKGLHSVLLTGRSPSLDSSCYSWVGSRSPIPGLARFSILVSREPSLVLCPHPQLPESHLIPHITYIHARPLVL